MRSPRAALGLLALLGAMACRTPVESARYDAAEDAPPASDAATDAADAAPPPVDAHDEIVAAAREALDAGTWEGGLLGAASMHTSVLDRPDWPPDPDAGAKASGSGVRLGYLRHGTKVAALGTPIVNEGCKDGWYELVEGGWVCGKYATFDLRDPRVRLAPAPPKLGEAMPYKYGFSLGHGTPVYRRVLSVEDRKKYEPWLVPPPPAPEKSEEAGEEGAEPAAPAPTAASVPDASVPWFMRPTDGGRPPVTLDDLHGRGVLVRRMMRGFYLALDRDFRAAHARWWRTTAGFAVPFERVALQPPPSDFHGAWIRTGDAIDPKLLADGGPATEEPTGAAALVTSGYASRWSVDPEAKKVAPGPPLPKSSALALVGEPVTIAGTAYQKTTYGFWLRLADALVVTPAPPADLEPDETWIDVDATRQVLVAFEGRRPVYVTLVSSGKKHPTDPDKNWTTPPGTYRIREKHVTATMDGDVAADGPYSIEDVPWVMYFQGSYALHAAFWHNGFGHPRSHGCVNLSPVDARELFFWAKPRLPAGWHGVLATDASPGTRVVVHEDAKKK